MLKKLGLNFAKLRFQKFRPRVHKTLDMISEGLGEMIEGDFADTCGEKIPLLSMWGWSDPSSVRRQGGPWMTPISASRIFQILMSAFS